MLATLILCTLLLPQEPTQGIVPCAPCAALTEPPCSYVSTQNEKGLVLSTDPVLAWIRAKHNGGCVPLRHFLAGPRVINDTYGLFFYDPDGGYVAAYEKAYGYRFLGWRRGVMIVQHEDGTLFSALTGTGIDGPRRGQQLPRVPNLMTTWGHWLLLHPESTAYDMFDGTKYPVVELPGAPEPKSVQTRGSVDARLPAESMVLGVKVNGATMAFPLQDLPARTVLQDKVAGVSVAVFWYEPTRSAVAYRAVKNDTKLEFQADAIAPPVAPFQDKNTGTRWSLAGRGIDGLLRGEELTWVDCIQCRWFAWVAEHPETALHGKPVPAEPKK